MANDSGSEIRLSLEQRRMTAWIVTAILLKDLPDDPDKRKEWQQRFDRNLPMMRQFANNLAKSLTL